jgi:hypothetical protein
VTTVATLAAALQSLFTATAELLGRLSGFIQRQRDLSAAAFAQTLVFGWIDRPRAPLESFAVALDLSAQALPQRMTPAAQAFFQALLAHAMTLIQAAQPTRLRLLNRFGAVVVEDTTVIALPADLAAAYRGAGGADRAALKVPVRWELLTGQLLLIDCAPGVTGDTTLAATAADLPAGALHLADQGFFDTRRWAALAPGQSWISRVPAGVAVAVAGRWQPLAALLTGLRADTFDGPVQLVASHQLACRLTARRCPPEVAARRRQRLRASTRSKKGRALGARQLGAGDWVVLATNVPAQRLTAAELGVVYRCRWQVELLFKRGKQQLRWTFSRGRKGGRVLAEVLAKLLACVVVHWGALRRGGPLGGVSPVELFAVVRRYALRLAAARRRGRGLRAALVDRVEELGRVRPQPKRHTKPSTRQLLDNPELGWCPPNVAELSGGPRR